MMTKWKTNKFNKCAWYVKHGREGRGQGGQCSSKATYCRNTIKKPDRTYDGWFMLDYARTGILTVLIVTSGLLCIYQFYEPFIFSSVRKEPRYYNLASVHAGTKLPMQKERHENILNVLKSPCFSNFFWDSLCENLVQSTQEMDTMFTLLQSNSMIDVRKHEGIG